MAYQTEEQRKAAIKESKHRYYMKMKEKMSPEKKKQKELRRKRLVTKEYVMLSAAKHRAKRTGKEFSISITDIIIPEFCPVLGIRLNLENSGTLPDSPSLDRIDSSKGYVQGNIRVISWRANKLKSDASLEEIEKIFLYMQNKA